MALEDLAMIGNCQFAALISRFGSVEWCCLPRFDAEPVFGRLLDPDGGSFSVTPATETAGVQEYLENTNVLSTTFTTPEGKFRVIDFAPRYTLHQRSYHPTRLFRIIEPIEGSPRVRVACNPVLGWSKNPPERRVGSHHIRYTGYHSEVRLTTDVPISFLDGEAFALTGRRVLALTWGDPIEEPLGPLAVHELDETVRHWRQWVKQCDVPPMFQKEVIRSALVLKLCCFEDTGAIIAAPTTSIPESPGSGRTWDYRYCWLRDTFYTLDAFRLLGHFEEREAFVEYLLTVAGRETTLELKPLYAIDGKDVVMPERELTNWAGYEGNGPVRVGNAAAAHQQHDVFGELVLALSPVFFDERFADQRSEAAWKLLERLAARALKIARTPDAGLWELRTGWQVHTFSSMMCWAAGDRVAKLAKQRGAHSAVELMAGAEALKQNMLADCWNPAKNSFTAIHHGTELDAALLQLPALHFLPASDPRLRATVDAVRRELEVDGWLYRYKIDDGFGRPTVAFILCTFWLVEALARLGDLEEARKVLQRALPKDTLGLIAEDIDPKNRRMWGNFPQAYSHVGLIRAAFAASPPWHDFL